MFDSPFDFLTLVIAIVAIIFARKALGQIAALQRRLDAIEAAGVAAARTAVPPPLAPLQEFEQTLPARRLRSHRRRLPEAAPSAPGCAERADQPKRQARPHRRCRNRRLRRSRRPASRRPSAPAGWCGSAA